MVEIKGIYAASVSVLNDDMSLNIKKTANHCEKIIKDGCHGVVIFGSTGQAQLISLAEKIQMVTYLSKNKNKDNFIIGCGLNSLLDTINLMKVSVNLGFKKFLVMPPAYYKYGDKEVINYYTKLVNSVPESKIILYNFEKLCGYKFSTKCVEELSKIFPKSQKILMHIVIIFGLITTIGGADFFRGLIMGNLMNNAWADLSKLMMFIAGLLFCYVCIQHFRFIRKMKANI